MAIAAFTLALADRMPEAGDYAKRIRERVPDYSMADFLGAFRMAPDATDLFKRAGKKVGLA